MDTAKLTEFASMWRVILISLWLLGGTFILAKIGYNLFLHPLRHHPGPKLWAATRLPWCWNQYRGRLNHRLVELHRQYGPTLRVAPNEISYNSKTAWKTIYGNRVIEMKKDPIFSLVTPTGVPNIMTADRMTHSRHRRLLSHAFSEKALREQEDVLVKYCTKLLAQLDGECAKGPVDLTDWYHLTTFDLIGSLAFGEDFSCVDTGKAHPFVASIKAVSRELIMSQMATYYGISALRNWFLNEMVDARIARGPTSDRKDFWHYVLAADETDTSDKHKSLSSDEMVVNAFSIAIAGSDGTATALTATTFLLLTHPQVYQQLRDNIRAEFAIEDDIKSTALAGDRIPLLDAVLNEAMRLYPPVAVTLPRVVPPWGATIDGLFVPGGTTVGVNHLATYHSEKNFCRAKDFLPERWLEDKQGPNKTQSDVKATFQPFSVGPRSCLGKNLAKAEMRLILARLLWRFDLELEGESEDWMKGQRIYGFWVKPSLMCRLSPRSV
ncbi:cytochrome P450 [Ilyonectria robusta]|uniref:cytochrome P450 n=1 Tax=Ilyonectria robusta TaxID=1079257 RepID=UPI001E8D41BD|nr:cytochrome P450 [Ilyonectria robusta]KAH8736553.1 cytochrome P450 [Ilyonectria robusta]